MLLLRIEYDSSYYKGLLIKLRKVRRKYPIHIDIVKGRDVTKGKDVIYMSSLDDGFSVAFLYQAYLKARRKGLSAELIYGRYISEDWIPKDIRKFSEKWIAKRLSKEDIKLLKNTSITRYIFERWYTWL